MSQYVATIHVRPKSEIRDPQGESVAGALRALGFEIADVRTGKEIVVRFEAADDAKAAEAARTMGDQLLANPVIEDYAIELGGTAADAVHADVAAAARGLSPVPADAPVRVAWLLHTPRSSTGAAVIRDLPRHIHREHDEIIHVLSGTAEFTLGDRTVPARAGEVVAVPAGVVHTVRPTSADCVLSTVFAPEFDPDKPDRQFVE